VLRKETAFPLWRAVERNVVSLLSSVINIVIIIIFDPGTQFPANEKNYAMQYRKVQKSSWNKPYSS